METERLSFRRWQDSDAAELFRYAVDPSVGPIAGWPPHKSIDDSLWTIQNVFPKDDTYAMILKETGLPIGCISLMTSSTHDLQTSEYELGYWLGKPYWGKGLMTEAAQEIVRYAFEELNTEKIWCGYYEGNQRSARVQEKIGFVPNCINENVDVPLMGEQRTEYLSLLTKEQWEENTRKKR